MPSQEEIEQQQKLLAIYRHTLADWLAQEAKFSLHTPPHVYHGIREARANIQSIKELLRTWGVVVENHPNDIDPSQEEVPSTSGSQGRNSQSVKTPSNSLIILGIIFASATTIIVALIFTTSKYWDSSGQNTASSSPTSLNLVSTAPATLTDTIVPPPNITFIDSGQRLGSLATQDVALGDLDGDRDLDAFVVNGEGLINEVGNQVWLNNGSGRFIDSGQKLGNATCYAVALADLDNDGDLDAYVGTSEYNDGDEVWLNDGKGKFKGTGQKLTNAHSIAVALGDVDGDGDIDAFTAVLQGMENSSNQVWLNDGEGVFRDSGQRLGRSRNTDIALGDVDGDGDLDAFVTSYDDSNVIWLNDGFGRFSNNNPDQNLGYSNSSAVALGDLDKDGDLDAFVGNISGNEIWFNDGRGRFSNSKQKLGNTASRDIALADLDRDGDLDAVIASNNGEDANSVWINDGTGKFGENLQVKSGRVISVAVAVGDLDNDKDLDVFVGNNGGSNSVTIGGAPNFVFLNQ